MYSIRILYVYYPTYSIHIIYVYYTYNIRLCWKHKVKWQAPNGTYRVEYFCVSTFDLPSLPYIASYSSPLGWVPSPTFGCGGRGGGGAQMGLDVTKPACLYSLDDVITPACGTLERNPTCNINRMSSSL